MSDNADSRAPSPGAPEVDEDDGPPIDGASENGGDEQAAPQVANQRPSSTRKPKFLSHYGKKYYEVPEEAVVWNKDKPIEVDSGLKAHEIHECKSFDKWVGEYGVHTRNIIKIKVDDGDAQRMGLYVTFRIDGRDTPDVYIVRALHKTIAKKFHESWTIGDNKWSDEKLAKYSELVCDVPADESQLKPDVLKWKLAAAPSGVLYQRPKKEKKEAPPAAEPSAKKQGVMKKQAVRAVDDEYDHDDSSAEQSTALIGIPQQPMTPQMPHMGGGAGSTSFFFQTPGMVTISEGYLQHLIANQRN